MIDVTLYALIKLQFLYFKNLVCFNDPSKAVKQLKSQVYSALAVLIPTLYHLQFVSILYVHATVVTRILARPFFSSISLQHSLVYRSQTSHNACISRLPYLANRQETFDLDSDMEPTISKALAFNSLSSRKNWFLRHHISKSYGVAFGSANKRGKSRRRFIHHHSPFCLTTCCLPIQIQKQALRR